MNTAPQPEPSKTTGPEAHFAGGLPRAERGTLQAVFTALMVVGFLDVFVLLLLPYGLHRGTDSPWISTERLGFLGFAVLVGNAFGLLTSVVADRRLRSPWWYLAGHLGSWVAPFLAMAGMAETSPMLARIAVLGACALGTFASFVYLQISSVGTEPCRGPITRVLSRFLFQVGNIWFGLGLLLVVIVALVVGTNIEDKFGHKAAQHMVYGGAAFGLFYMVFAASLLAATLRKFPWRFDQTGWLTVHAALILIVIGTFMTFWGKKEGYLTMMEKEDAATFFLSDQTRLEVHRAETRQSPDGSTRLVPGQKVWSTVADFDVNPADTQPSRSHRITDEKGRELFDVTIDRYFADAKRKVIKGNTGKDPRWAADVTVKTPMGGDIDIELVERDRDRSQQQLIPGFSLWMAGTLDARQFEALLGGRDQEGFGQVVVRDQNGKELLRLPIPEGTRPDAQSPTTLSVAAEIPGTDMRLEVAKRFDTFGVNGREVIDERPGTTNNPALETALITKDGTRVERLTFAFIPAWSKTYRERETGQTRDIVIEYDFIPKYDLETGWLTFASKDNGPLHWIYQGKTGGRLSGLVAPGLALDMGPSGPKVGVVVDAAFDRFEERQVYELKDVRAESNQVVRANIKTTKGAADVHWIPLGSRGAPVVLGDEVFLVRWVPTSMDLGFDLHLHEFNREFYPGQMVAKTYESYLALSGGPRFGSKPVNIKIDMNKPLVYNGWRLFQSRFSSSADMRQETTTLQVNKDPGLPVTYFACALLAIGLIVVFFQKPFLRAFGRKMKERRATILVQFLAALLVVAGAVLATGPGMAVLKFGPEGPLMLLGVLLIILGLFAETLILNKMLSPRLQRS